METRLNWSTSSIPSLENNWKPENLCSADLFLLESFLRLILTEISWAEHEFRNIISL